MDIIVDIDGTIADISHRAPLLPKNRGFNGWDAFFDACVHDRPIEPIIKMVFDLRMARHRVIFLTGRSRRIEEKTRDWIAKHVRFLPYEYDLFMREEGDHRPDVVVKREMLTRLRASGYKPVIAIEDRKGVAAMWREEGLICLHCDEGDF